MVVSVVAPRLQSGALLMFVNRLIECLALRGPVSLIPKHIPASSIEGHYRKAV